MRTMVWELCLWSIRVYLTSAVLFFYLVYKTGLAEGLMKEGLARSPVS